MRKIDFFITYKHVIILVNLKLFVDSVKFYQQVAVRKEEEQKQNKKNKKKKQQQQQQQITRMLNGNIYFAAVDEWFKSFVYFK